MIRAAGLEKRYGPKRVLRGLDFELERGGFLVVTGPNGAGKTTLLRLCAGLAVPTGGTLEVEPERGERIGMLLERFGLWDVRDAHVSTFSRGMRQRLGLCRVLLHDPELVILDEPFNALDAAGSDLLDETLDELAARSAVVVATHDPGRVERLATQRLAFP